MTRFKFTDYSLIFVIIFSFFVIFACNSSNKNNNTNKEKEELFVDDVYEEDSNVNKIEKIFYNIPSPIEMAHLTQKSKVKYNSSLLNSTNNVENYSTTIDLALNLGVYGADLSYCRLYDQIQESIEYLSVIRTIIDELKIPQEKASISINKLENNVNNRDTLLQIITETYGNADLYLKENDRESTAALIILGGWIEALYISTHMLDENNPNHEIMCRIAEQKYSLNNLIKLLSSLHDKRIKDFLSVMMPNLKNLDLEFNKIKITQGEYDILTDKKTKKTSINSNMTIDVSYKQINDIKKQATFIRNLIIK
ncbi:MAG: hypothetical protein DRJ01_13865 [Bacteroidetes bacterium]|nr:MAG: hypothetical protein DRJ01_13865 [Bacteroidota bacterium]